ncbi:MAG: hypothetical protein DRP11_02035 [Candidatus Aenigmatarchaeota archaeon]|nr:MAG: hypothetical protein DRP11_02035 [Candidatus Aenigmarchaeota archaeon]
MLRTKSQVSLELMAFTGIIMLMLVMYTPIFWQQERAIIFEREDLIGNAIALSIEKEVNTAVRFGSGYSRNFTLPERILSKDYNITIYNESRILSVDWYGGGVNRQLITPKIIGSPSPGQNRIENVNGVVIFNG